MNAKEKVAIGLAVVAILVTCVIYGGTRLWNELVLYRMRDGAAFVRAMDEGNYGYALAGHRCYSEAMEKFCISERLGPFRNFDDECVSPKTLRCKCDHLSEAFCYTVFPVSCATDGNDGKPEFDTCDCVFPHGWHHAWDLASGGW